MSSHAADLPQLTSRLAVYSRPPARPGLLLVLEDEQGHVGLGEASPLAPFSRDEIQACERALRGIHARIGPLVEIEFDERSAIERGVALGLAPLERELAALPSARFALESALFDLLARRAGKSVSSAIAKEKVHAAIPRNGLLFAEPTDTLAERALALAKQGFTALKIKLRAPDDEGFARELEALLALRRALPLPFELRLDPNAAWTLEEARRRLEALAPLAPRYVEQPVPPELLLELALASNPVPIAADESLLDRSRFNAILEAEACTTLILKPHALGGISRALAIAREARSHRKDLVVTHFFDGPVAMAITAELALALPGRPLACGIDLHPALAGYPPIEIPQLAQAAFITKSAAPGIGLDFDASWIPSA